MKKTNEYAMANGWGFQNGAFIKGEASVSRLASGGWILWIGSVRVDTFASAELAMGYVDATYHG